MAWAYIFNEHNIVEVIEYSRDIHGQNDYLGKLLPQASQVDAGSS
jgi:hypothetical protein